MADNSAIHWTDATWNIVTGCTKVGDGCLNCYIERTPPFRIEHRRFNGDGIGATTGVRLHPDRLGIPQRWRKPRMIFVCSLADLFHDEVPDAFIAEAFAVMSICPQHTFQVLTKRHGRLRSLLTSGSFWALVNAARNARGHADLPAGRACLDNVWIGVSCENQAAANLRIPALIDTPAAVRWVSAEPLLGPIDLDLSDRDAFYDGGISWVVVGGESGPGHRPVEIGWIEAIVDQCYDSVHTRVFVKQDSGQRAGQQGRIPDRLWIREYPAVAP